MSSCRDGRSVAAVVVTYNRKNLLSQCLDCLLGQKGASCDILVIDNASTDGTEAMVATRFSTPRVRYFNTGNNLGGAGGFMCGIEAAIMLGYDYVWIMDDDCLPNPDALQKLLLAGKSKNGNWGFLSSAVYWTDGRLCRANRAKKDLFRHINSLDRITEPEPVVMGSFVSMLVPTHVVREVGLPIGEYFIWSDDYEFSRRISKRYPCFLVPSSQVTHAMTVNTRADLATAEKSKLGRFRHLYRNDVHCYRQDGLIGHCYLIAKAIFTGADVMLRAKSGKREKLEVLIQGYKAGFDFTPRKEFPRRIDSGEDGASKNRQIKVKYVVTNYRFIKEHEYGALKKIDSHVKAFRDAGFDCHIDDCNSDYTLFWKVVTRMPFAPDGVDWASVNVGDYDAVYIRRPAYCSKQLLSWLKHSKEVCPNSKFLLEFQTYPYDAEYYKLYRLPLLIKDRVHRNQLKHYIDRAVDLSGANAIFGIPTLQFFNGIDLDSETVRCVKPSVLGEVRLLCVAVFNTWHGVDRLLQGMADYRNAGGQRSIVLHLVGDGPVLNDLKGLVKKLRLSDSVVFYGRVKSEEFSHLYNECDIAIASLGLHRIGIDTASTLKTREYLAKGVPFAYSGEIDVFRDEPVDFCLRFPADDSPIEVDRLIEFCDGLYSRENPEKLTKRIRDYAERHVGMDAAMKPVIDYIKKECEK